MILHNPEGEAVELGDGRGDLRRSSMPIDMWDGSPFFENLPVSYAKIFASQPWVAIAVMRLLTWAVRVPLKLYRRLDDDGARERVRPNEHPLARALVSPWDRGSQADLIQYLLGPLCVHGNDLMDVQEGAGGRIRFDPVDWRQVTPIRLEQADPNGEILGWTIHEAVGGTDTRSADTVMHTRWWSPLGQNGISPLRQLRSTLVSEAAAVEWALNNLAQGARPDGVVEMRDEAMALEPEMRRALYERGIELFRENYGGPKNAGKLPVMPPAFQWVTAERTTAVEAALLDQRAINHVEAAAIYMLPPPMIGLLERSTFNNILTLREMAYTDGLAPPLVLIEQTMNAHVIDGLLRADDLYAEFDFGLILRGDRLKEIRALREGIGMAIYTPEEARGALNLPKTDQPGADKLYLPSNNLSPLGATEENNDA